MRTVPLRDRRFWRTLLGSRIGSRLREFRDGRRVLRSPDRRLLLQVIFPALVAEAGPGAEILWIGCRRYTRKYYAILESRGAKCWTMDIDPEARIWGARDRHVVGDLVHADDFFSRGSFDMVLCNGVFGWGIDTPEMQSAAWMAMARITKPGGWMLLGWNEGRIADPATSPAGIASFDHSGVSRLPKRIPVPGATHIFDFFRRRSAAPPPGMN